MSHLRKYLEQKQVERRHNLTTEQLEQLCASFDAEYCAEVMIELGHDNEEIKHWTKLNGCRISWMRVKYDTPPSTAGADLAHAELNATYAHMPCKRELLFNKLFHCGVYGKYGRFSNV
jgi:hypothetical protein